MKSNHYKKVFNLVVIFFIICRMFLPFEILANGGLEGSYTGMMEGITCPDNIVTANDPGQCYAIVYYTPPPNSYRVSGLASGSMFPVGITEITYSLNDNSDSCMFTVQVNDVDFPELSCPDDIIQSYEDGAVYYEFPEGSDNCGEYIIIQTAGLPSGSVFPVGNTLNSFIIADPAGNTANCGFTVTITGSHAEALLSDGSVSQVLAPQGKFRYQRGFYLMTREELDSSDLTSGMEINSIGFTIGVAQDKKTSGNFKVYLRNTTDTVSRINNNWHSFEISYNYLTLNTLDPAEYEWRVKDNSCSGDSAYSYLQSFDNTTDDGCRQPYNLETHSITYSSAVLTWNIPVSSSFTNFMLIYGIPNSNNSDTVFLTEKTYSVTGLMEDAVYQWSVRTICSDDSSPLSAATFTTLSRDLCNEPTGLANMSVTDESAKVSWTKTADAVSYEVALRRSGTSFWMVGNTVKDNYTFYGLKPGTTYEWKVRTVCSAGKGSYVNGSDITTSGETFVYAPEGLKTSEISDTSATFYWLALPGDDVIYEFSYRLKEYITWDYAIDSMTKVSDGEITIPDDIGPYDIPFVAGSPFIYEDKGIYIAWEYSNPSGELSSENSSLCTSQHSYLKGANGADSIKLIKSFVGRTNENSAELPASLRAIDMRPETRLGSPGLMDSLEVASVYTMGHVSMPYGCPVPISAVVKNYMDHPRNVPVNLKINDLESGSTIYTNDQSCLIPAYGSKLVSFISWEPVKSGIYSVIVTVPVQEWENVVDNNINSYQVMVGRYIESYDDASPAINGAGFGEGSGMIISRFRMNGCGKVNSARVYMHWSAEKHPLYAVVLDEDGNIKDTSFHFTPDSTTINNYHTFFFPNTPEISDAYYYIGLSQKTDGYSEYYPVGAQWEGSLIREGVYYRANLDGSGLTDHPFPGRLMIQAEILPAMPEPMIEGSEILCEGSTNNLRAVSRCTRFANKIIGYSSEFSNFKSGAIQALGSPDMNTDNSSDLNVWMSDTVTSREYLILNFPDPAPINFIEIYMAENPGSVDKVSIKKTNGDFQSVYEDNAKSEPAEDVIRHIRFSPTSYSVKEVKIEMGISDTVSGYRKIDAVGIGQINDTTPAFSSYLWIPGMETTQSIEVDASNTITLKVTNENDCELSARMDVITPEPSAPIISWRGPTEFCQGDTTVVLRSSEIGHNRWNTGETADSIIVADSGSYSVTHFNGCDSVTSEMKVINVHSLPVVHIIGGPICIGSVEVLDAGAGYESYLWSTGETTQSISVNTPGNYEVTVNNSFGCSGTGMVHAFYAPVPKPHINGNPFFCPGESAILDAGPGFRSYLWSNGATTRKTTISTAGVVFVTVTNVYGCEGSDMIVTAEYEPPHPVISGTLSMCAGSSTVLDAGSGYAAYEWSTGEISQAINVDEAGNYIVIVTDQHGCVGSDTVSVDTNGTAPAVPGPISGPTGGICQKTGLVYSIAPMSNVTHYVWTVSEGLTITEGQGTTSIKADASALESGYISVAASNKCGQSPTWNGRALYVEGAPEAPGQITGQQFGVCGRTGLIYSIVPVYGATSYSWNVPGGATIQGGNGTNSIQVNFTNSYGGGDICVSAENSCGTSAVSCLFVQGAPAQAGEISGPVIVCPKQKNVVYSIAPVAYAISYTWAVPQQAVIVSGQGTTSIKVNFGSKSGNISVYASNSCGNGGVRQLAVVVGCKEGELSSLVKPPEGGWIKDPNQLWGNEFNAFFPEVIASSGAYFNEFPASLSWTLGESVIETVKEDRFMLSQGFHQGNYEIVTAGGDDEDYLFRVEVYPNPSRDIVNIRIISLSESVNMVLEMYDLIGNVVYKQNVKSRDIHYQLDLNAYSTQMFILKVVDVINHQQRSFKIIKVKS